MGLAHWVLSVVTSAGIVQGVFLAIAILRKGKGSRAANQFLAFALLFFAANIAVQEILFSGGDGSLERYFLVIGGFQLLLGPLLLFYVRVLRADIGGPELVPAFRHRGSDVAHLVPLLLYLSVIVCVRAASGSLSPGVLAAIETARHYSWIAFFAHTISYFVAIHFLARDLGLRLRSRYSTVEKLDLSWLRYIIVAFVATYAVIAALLIFLSHDHPLLPMDKSVSFVLSILVYALGWRGYFQGSGRAGAREQPPKYARSGVTAEETPRILDSVRTLMEEEKPYLDPDLTLPALAAEAGLAAGDLSRVINGAARVNFYDFVNAYRIEEAKRLLVDADHAGRSILDIAFGVGFRSKSTFNACFKKLTGLTPRSFRLRRPSA